MAVQLLALQMVSFLLHHGLELSCHDGFIFSQALMLREEPPLPISLFTSVFLSCSVQIAKDFLVGVTSVGQELRDGIKLLFSQ
jgi:hypothetical protein